MGRRGIYAGKALDGVKVDGKTNCYYCSCALSFSTVDGSERRGTRDHFWPESKYSGCPDHLYMRLVPACEPCNRAKSDLLPIEWFHHIMQTITAPSVMNSKTRRQARIMAAQCLSAVHHQGG